MALFSGVESFVHTAEKRSFRAAAVDLGVSPTAISKAVAGLEAELGVRLLNRTTRSVSLTSEGEVYLRHCREAVDRLQAGRDYVTRSAQVAQGKLKVSMSFVLGRPVIGALHRLLDRYPRVELHVTFSDRAVDLVAEEVDVVVRIGDLADSTLVGRRVCTPRWVTVAAPSYLARTGELRDWTELSEHACLQFAGPAGAVIRWTFAAQGRRAPRVFRPQRRVLLDHGDLLVDAAVAGLGVCQVFDFMVQEHLRRGELVEVLRHQSAPGPGVHALCLPGRQEVPKIRAFTQFVAEVLGSADGERARRGR
ncbi:MAG: LysR family transcriptional regulator [Sandaracinaceae bacterium]|nr:LysR family transcriptional regulator [Sandaracinaceae bacterium]